MNDTNQPEQAQEPQSAASLNAVEPIPERILSRIKLALLDEYKTEQRGYDPYDASKGRRQDVWSAKRKRA